MARISSWNPKVLDKEIRANGMKRLEKSGEVVARKARFKVKVRTGALKRSIRVVKKRGLDSLNVRIYAGNKEAWYAQIVEFRNPYLRTALRGAKAKIKSIMQDG